MSEQMKEQLLKAAEEIRHAEEPSWSYVCEDAARHIEHLEAQLSAYKKDAERWRTLEYLWYISESIEIRPGDDIDKWELHFDGVECASASWDGGDLAEIVDKIKAQFDATPDEECDAADDERAKRGG